MSTYLKTMILGSIAAGLLINTAVTAQTPHVMAPVNDAKWGPAPPMLPAGAQIAVLAGDPSKAAPYTVRLKFPANYDIAAHSHPGDENVLVTSGELFIGMGTKLNRTSATTLGTGGYALMPKGMNHFAFTKSDTTIVLYGIGPVDFKYVNPSDDPRKGN
jgi:quercetin dioxygenase-like cupin family protein